MPNRDCIVLIQPDLVVLHNPMEVADVVCCYVAIAFHLLTRFTDTF